MILWVISMQPTGSILKGIENGEGGLTVIEFVQICKQASPQLDTVSGMLLVWWIKIIEAKAFSARYM